MLRPAAVAIAMLAVGACAVTRPGKYYGSDFVWEEVTLPTSYFNAYRRVVEGFRQCGASRGALFVTHIGVPECFDDREREAVLCDVYFGSTRGGRSNHVLGRIELLATADHETRAKLGVVRGADNPWFGEQGATRNTWLRFVRGEEPCGK